MTLRELADRLEQLDEDLTIYAVGGAGAGPESPAAVTHEPEDGSVPSEAAGMEYLLEVAQAQEALEVWRQWRDGRDPTPEETCEAIIYYARNDAYLPA